MKRYFYPIFSLCVFFVLSSPTEPAAKPQAPARRPRPDNLWILRTTGRMVKCTSPAIRLGVAKPPNTWDGRTPYQIGLKTIRNIDSAEEVVQIECFRFIGNNTNVPCWLADTVQGSDPFSCKSSPSAALTETLFVLHHTSDDGVPERVNIRTPAGKWIAFTSDSKMKPVDDMDNASNFEIWPLSERFFEGPPR
jgi:hypothetical protein